MPVIKIAAALLGIMCWVVYHRVGGRGWLCDSVSLWPSFFADTIRIQNTAWKNAANWLFIEATAVSAATQNFN